VPTYAAAVRLTSDLLCWKLAHRLLQSWGTFTPILVFLRLLVSSYYYYSVHFIWSHSDSWMILLLLLKDKGPKPLTCH